MKTPQSASGADGAHLIVSTAAAASGEQRRGTGKAISRSMATPLVALSELAMHSSAVASRFISSGDVAMTGRRYLPLAIMIRGGRSE
jgi:hypothetical protein